MMIIIIIIINDKKWSIIPINSSQEKLYQQNPLNVANNALF